MKTRVTPKGAVQEIFLLAVVFGWGALLMIAAKARRAMSGAVGKSA